MKLEEVTAYPVRILLNKKNPWGKTVKVNNIVLSIENYATIASKAELQKLKPAEKYLVIEAIEKVEKTVQPEAPKKTRKKKTTEGSSE